MSWFKKIARWRGGIIPIADDYERGHRPEAEDHKEDNDTLTRPTGEFGGNTRPGYPKGISESTDNEETSDYAKIHGEIPGEAVLMDDGGDNPEGLGDRFESRGEGIEDNDTLPIGMENESVRLDKGEVGPHSMPRNKGNLFTRIKKDTKIKGLKF